jgi:hypothetical protein
MPSRRAIHRKPIRRRCHCVCDSREAIRRPALRGGVDGNLILNIRHDGGSYRERSVSFILVTVLSVALVRLALLWVYPKRASWD